MSEGVDWETRLIEACDSQVLTRADISGLVQPLEAWLARATAALAGHRLQRPPTLKPTHALAPLIAEIDGLLATRAGVWSQQWADLEPSLSLARDFDQQLMLLVFGKFNAGKSSLCNLLADRFAARGRAVQFFHVDSDGLVESTQPFREGATETTARLQGVRLGGGLVLLDTPGQHSVTPENAALTQRFTDSADAVLWLTSSTSPGQVQELNELARELQRGKPLLPVITRSDVVEEDEIGGEIVKQPRNKTLENRRMQEDDVQLRAREKLRQMGVAPEVLRPAVSVSAHMTRAQGQTVEALTEGGLMRLYAALCELVDPARAYQQRKPAEVLLHHLEENVLGAMTLQIAPAASRLLDQLALARERLFSVRPRMESAVWRQVAPELPRLIDEHTSVGDMALLCRELGDLLTGALAQQITTSLGDYECPRPDIDPPAITVTDSHEQQHDALQSWLQQQIVQQLDSVFKPCHHTLDALGTAAEDLLALPDQLAAELAPVRHRLRGGGD